MSEFVREHRYLVMKYTDIRKYFSAEDKANLLELAHKLSKGRCDDEKMPLDCVVVEKDWPEYEDVWAMIEERVKREERYR